MAQNQHLSADDSEWEYEYDESQAEDFYFTLDLPGTFEPPSKRRKIATQKAKDNEAMESDVAADRPQHITNGQTRQLAAVRERASEPLHFTGLHTASPTVDCEGQRYDCRWTTDLGTQFHVSRKGVTQQPFREGHVMDVIALSRVRLTGLNPTTAPPSIANGIVPGVSVGEPIDLDDDEDDDEEDEEEDGDFVDTTTALTDTNGALRPSFLERVAEIQRRKAAQSANGLNDAPSNAVIVQQPPIQPVSRSPNWSVENGAISHSTPPEEGQPQLARVVVSPLVSQPPSGQEDDGRRLLSKENGAEILNAASPAQRTVKPPDQPAQNGNNFDADFPAPTLPQPATDGVSPALPQPPNVDEESGGDDSGMDNVQAAEESPPPTIQQPP